MKKRIIGIFLAFVLALAPTFISHLPQQYIAVEAACNHKNTGRYATYTYDSAGHVRYNRCKKCGKVTSKGWFKHSWVGKGRSKCNSKQHYVNFKCGCGAHKSVKEKHASFKQSWQWFDGSTHVLVKTCGLRCGYSDAVKSANHVKSNVVKKSGKYTTYYCNVCKRNWTTNK